MVKISFLLKLIEIQCNLNQNTSKFFLCRNCKDLNRAILKKFSFLKNKVGELLYLTKTYHKAKLRCIIKQKIVWCWHRQKGTNKWNIIENLDIESHIYGELIFDKSANITESEKYTLFNKGVRTTGYPNTEKSILIYFFFYIIHTQKSLNGL